MEARPSGLPLPSAQLEAIASVIVEWSYFESVLEVAIWSLAYLPADEDIAAAITTHLPWRIRIQILATLFARECERREQDPDEIPKVEERQRQFAWIRKEAERLAALRNEYVHARWISGSKGSPMTYVIKARVEIRRELVGRSTEHVSATARDIATLSNALRAMFAVPEGESEES
jgi:hypothetical protein